MVHRTPPSGPETQTKGRNAPEPPDHHLFGSSEARLVRNPPTPANEKTPAPLGTGVQLRIHNHYEPFLTVQCRNLD